MSAASRPPSRDWARDFDHLDPRWSNDPYPIWAELRRACPVAHTERFEGCYFPTTYAGVQAVASDPMSFSSRRVVVRDHKVEPVLFPPITADPPAHKSLKRALLPLFTPDEIVKLESRARAVCNDLIDTFPVKGGEVADLYTKHIPVRLIAHMLGLPETDGNLFRRWLHELFELGVSEPSLALRVTAEMGEYLT